MAVTRLTAFTDTTEQTVTAARAYVKGIRVFNPARTATGMWVQLFNLANPTPGTDLADIVIYCPFATSNTSSFAVTFPRIYFDTAITAFASDTNGGSASAWVSSGNTGYSVEVYWERA